MLYNMSKLPDNESDQKSRSNYPLVDRLINVFSLHVLIWLPIDLQLYRFRPLEAIFGLPGMDAVRNIPVLGTILAQPLSGDNSSEILIRSTKTTSQLDRS